MISEEFNLSKQLDMERKEGLEEGELRLSSLIQKLLADSRSNDLERVLSDTEYRKILYKEYNIE